MAEGMDEGTQRRRHGGLPKSTGPEERLDTPNHHIYEGNKRFEGTNRRGACIFKEKNGIVSVARGCVRTWDNGHCRRLSVEAVGLATPRDSRAFP